MKKQIYFLGLGIFTNALFAQQVQQKETDNSLQVVTCSEFSISKTIEELSQYYGISSDATKEESEIEVKNKRARGEDKNPNALPKGEDPARQKTSGKGMTLTTIQNFAGQGGGTPPDPSGAAGPNHYVQAINTKYRVYNKTGGALTSSLNLSSLLFGQNNGDPIVLYDKYADRWLISQFSDGSPENEIWVAISTTSSPTGSYYKYKFTTSQFPDYFKISIWADGYYVSSNQGTQKMLVFERDSMLAGKSTSRMISKNFSSIPTDGFFVPLPADADGQLPPLGTPCPIFSFEDDSWSSSSTDAIRVYKMAVTWGATPSATLILDKQLPTTAFNSIFTTSWDDITQKGTTQKLDAIAGVLTYRAPFRKWVGYNSVVLCHVVDVNGSNQGGVRWYELRQNDTTKVWSIYQQSTFAPDGESRWLGSIAMDDNGSIGMAYAVSGSSTFPSLRFTGRLASDPLNQMTFTEQTAIAGTSSQTGFERYGDYSQTSLDPDGITFWHTGEYIAGGIRTRIFSWQIPLSTGIEENLKLQSFNVFQVGDVLNISGQNTLSNNELVVDLFDVQGRYIKGTRISPINNSFDNTLSISNVKSGAYLVRIGNKDFQKVVKIIIQK